MGAERAVVEARARRQPGWRALIISAVAAALVGGGLGVGGVRLLAPPPPDWCDTTQVASAVLPSVVTIFVTGQTGQGSGSGAILTSDGLILTNDHVIALGARDGDIEVLLDNGRRLPATLIGRDPLTDLAVLKIDGTGYPALPLAPDVELSIGQPVIALGAPLGLSGTVTTGIVSALGRSVPVPKADGGTTVLLGAIQTDAAINPGNSGGPLVTCRRELIGVNTAISSVPSSSGSVGIGFAVPADTAQRIVDELLANGRATHPWIGAVTTEITPQTAAAFKTAPGLFVQAITPGGPADAAGLQPGDIITTIRGQRATANALAKLLVTAAVGDTVTITYVREGVGAQADLVLVEQPPT